MGQYTISGHDILPSGKSSAQLGKLDKSVFCALNLLSIIAPHGLSSINS